LLVGQRFGLGQVRGGLGDGPPPFTLFPPVQNA
jgi:hypothetical protein